MLESYPSEPDALDQDRRANDDELRTPAAPHLLAVPPETPLAMPEQSFA